jgi:hypothetical protein
MDLLKNVERVRNRHNYRVCAVLLLSFLYFFAALITPAFFYPYAVDAEKRMRLFQICELSSIVPFSFGIYFIFSQIGRDSVRFGALCPKRGKPLYSWRPLLFGGESFPDSRVCAACGWEMPPQPGDKA